MRPRLALDDEAFRALDLRRYNGGENPYPGGDTTIDNVTRPGLAFYRDYVARRTGFVGRARVLDLLCGFGRWTPFLAECNDHVIGVERLASCVNLGRNFCAAFGFANIEFIEGDLTVVERFPDGYFDYIWMYSALQYVERGYALRQVARLLRPGGRLYVGQYNSTGLMLKHLWQGVESDRIHEGASQWALEALARGPDADGNPNYATLALVPAICARFSLECVAVAETGRLDLASPGGVKSAEPSADRLVFGRYPATIEFVASKPLHATTASPVPVAGATRGWGGRLRRLLGGR